MNMITTSDVMSEWFGESTLTALYGYGQQNEHNDLPAQEIPDFVWNFRNGLLDKLKDYHEVIERIRFYDPSGYAMYRKFGAHIISESYRTYADEPFPEHWRKNGNTPSFGAVSFADMRDSPTSVFIKFAYFTKLKRSPPNVESVKREVYEITCWFVDDITSLVSQVCIYGYIDSDGRFKLLKNRISKTFALNPNNSKRINAVVRNEWIYPPIFSKLKEGETVEGNAHLFAKTVLESPTISNDGFRVEATKAGVTSVFNINMLRTPYFFSDREGGRLPNGSRKKIFHIVRTHARKNADGKTTNVKSHFRGERRFEWGGFDVEVMMSGYHAIDLNGFSGPGYDPLEVIKIKRKKFMTQEQFVEFFMSNRRLAA